MNMTYGHQGERVHYKIRTRPFNFFASRGNHENWARDLATKNGSLPKNVYLRMCMETRGNDVYVDVDMDARGHLNPLSGLMNPGAPSWFTGVDSLPAPLPLPPPGRQTPTNSFARFAYALAHMMSSLCNGFMRWLAA